MKRTHPQKDHWSKGKNVVRKDKTITQTFAPSDDSAEPIVERRTFDSVRKARQFMRVGGRW